VNFFKRNEFASLTVTTFEDLVYVSPTLYSSTNDMGKNSLLALRTERSLRASRSSDRAEYQGTAYRGVCSLSQLLQLRERAWISFVHD
jgi:hypothetical protein